VASRPAALTHVAAHHVGGDLHNALVQKVEEGIARHAGAEEHQREIGDGHHAPANGGNRQLDMQIAFGVKSSVQ